MFQSPVFLLPISGQTSIAGTGTETLIRLTSGAEAIGDSDVKVCVLGAGLQGVLCALELAELGHDVVIVDAAEQAISQASLHNEGKIHLGYVYAKDTSGKTAHLMAEAATRFSRLLDRWWPEADIEATASDPFDYLVMPNSLEAADWLAARYRQIDQSLSARLHTPGRSYLGRLELRPAHPLERAEFHSRYNAEFATAAFRTEERAIDLTRMAKVLRDALAVSPRVECRWNTKVKTVSETANGAFKVETEGDASDGPYDTVINALWSDRLRVDETIGIKTNRPFMFRQKLANRIQLPASPAGAKSVTMVIGPFGDFVSLPSGSCYLSWYPSGCLRRTTETAPPPNWNHTRETTINAAVKDSFAELSKRIRGLDCLIDQSTEVTSVPGIIFCWGDTDVDDPDSELHHRHDVGINTYRPGYHSIDTGKLTLAPLFAAQLAQRIGPI